MLRAFVVVALGGCRGPSGTAEPPAATPVPQPPALSQSIDTYVTQFGRHWGESFRFNGYVLVMRDGEATYRHGFGSADGRAFEATTAFPIASNTKGFTAAMVLELQERRMLSVHDRVMDLEVHQRLWS